MAFTRVHLPCYLLVDVDLNVAVDGQSSFKYRYLRAPSLRQTSSKRLN